MKFKKKFFIIGLFVVLFAGLIPGIVIGVILPELQAAKEKVLNDFWGKYDFEQQATNSSEIDKKTNKGWNPEKLKKQFKTEKNFIIYFGTEQCPYCKEFTDAMKKNKELTVTLRDVPDKKEDYLLYLYYIKKGLVDAKKEERKKITEAFYQELKVPKSDWKGGVPVLFFIKDGKFVESITPKASKISEIVDKVKEHYY